MWYACGLLIPLVVSRNIIVEWDNLVSDERSVLVKHPLLFLRNSLYLVFLAERRAWVWTCILFLFLGPYVFPKVCFHLSCILCSSILLELCPHCLVLMYCPINLTFIWLPLSFLLTALYNSQHQFLLEFILVQSFLLGIFCFFLASYFVGQCHDFWHCFRVVTLLQKLFFSFSDNAPLSDTLDWMSNNNDQIDYKAQNDHCGSWKADVVLNFRVIMNRAEHDQVIRDDDKFAFIKDVHLRIESIGSSGNVTCYNHEEGAAQEDGK